MTGMRQVSRLATVLATAFFLGGQALAESCPPLPERTEERSGLLEALKTTPDAASGRVAADAVWQFWMRAPDPESQRLLDLGMERRLSGDLTGSEAQLDALVNRCPDFAEGWNQRAFSRFLLGDLDGSLADIERTLALEPAHFGALSGQAQIYLRQGRRPLALFVIRKAVAVNPWMNERFLLESEGRDI